MHSVTRTIFPVSAFKVTHRVIFLTLFCKLLTRVATLSGGGARASSGSMARRLWWKVRRCKAVEDLVYQDGNFGPDAFRNTQPVKADECVQTRGPWHCFSYAGVITRRADSQTNWDHVYCLISLSWTPQSPSVQRYHYHRQVRSQQPNINKKNETSTIYGALFRPLC